VSGTAVYTSAFTPPTTPLTNIANTSVLFNYSNAQIYDAVGKNILETVGDAKVNTAIKKFGAGSMVFDGTGDWLIGPSNPSASFESGDFTIEGWIYPTVVTGTDRCIWETRSSGSDAGMVFFIDTNAKLSTYTSGAIRTVTSQSVVANTWQNIAICRASGVMTTYVNGVASNTASYSSAITCPGAVRIGVRQDNAQPYTGYIDDLRITKGLARYRYNFTPPTRAFANKGGTQTLTADEYFDYTTLLLPGNGTNNQNNHTFLDSSNNNFAITRNGNATQGTFSPFSQTGWSNYFDGTGDYLTLGTSTNLALGANDFTIECFLFMTAYNANGSTIWDYRTSGSTPNTMSSFFIGSTGSPIFYVANGSSLVAIITGSVSVPLNLWNHLALVRSGSTVTLYLNGVNIGSATNTTNLGIETFRINDPQGSFGTTGYFSNFRIVKGSAVYTSNFTPPTSALTAIANTQLLTCQSNRLIDSSTNNFAITRNGDTSVQAFSPFAPTASYAAANVGGSGYFDGSGDELSAASNAAFNLSSGAWTVEAWIYPTTSAGYRTIISGRSAIWEMGLNTGTYQLYFYNGSLYATTATVTPNAWNHVALSSNGTDIKMYINGVLDRTVTASTGSTATAVYIGSANTIQYFTGYIADARIVKGTQVYPSAFTPPTAPLTAITNTSLLTNFTNAGILDATSKNDLETVGNAQISTAQSKFGGSSMLFDGTGDYLLQAAQRPTTCLRLVVATLRLNSGFVTDRLATLQ